jgi:deoxyribonuclease IV
VLFGAHVSSAGGYAKARARGHAIGADVIQGFSQSPRQWRGPEIDLDALRADRAADRRGITQTFLHATYLINIATAHDELWEKSLECLTNNLLAGTAVGCDGVVLHIGSHLGAGFDHGVELVCKALALAFTATEEVAGEPCCRLLLENTAGAGYTMGRTFDELARVIDASGNDPRIGVCLDTQHAFASGIAYDSTERASQALDAFDAAVGLERLGLIHLNDSKVPFGANRDRHENLGEGAIGADALGLLLSEPRLADVPVVLEVPGSGDGPRAEDVERARAIHAAGVAARG